MAPFPAPPHPSSPRIDQYLTDGRGLFRVVTLLPAVDDAALVELEDCRTLDVVLVPARELFARLRDIAGRDRSRSPRSVSGQRVGWRRGVRARSP